MKKGWQATTTPEFHLKWSLSDYLHEFIYKLVWVLTQRFQAASCQTLILKLKPASNSFFGTTRLLFRISSVSVFIKTAPISSISFVAGSPNEVPEAAQPAHKLGFLKTINKL